MQDCPFPNRNRGGVDGKAREGRCVWGIGKEEGEETVVGLLNK